MTDQSKLLAHLAHVADLMRLREASHRLRMHRLRERIRKGEDWDSIIADIQAARDEIARGGLYERLKRPD